MGYEAPIKCKRCGIVIRKKPKAKTPKYCPPCRQHQQETWKEQIKTDRRRRVHTRL